MKKIILLSIITLFAFISGAQCLANFTLSVSGNTVQLTNTSSGTNFYNWSFGDGGNSSAINPSYTYANAGTYDICLSAYYQDSMGGFCVDTLCQQVTVQDTTGGSSCNADFTWTVSGNTVQFTNTSTGTNTNNWSFGDGGSSSSTNPSYTYSTPGTYWVCLDAYYWDSLQVNCADSVCYQIIIQDTTGGSSCNADFTWTVSGNTVQFTNTSTGTNTNNWSFGDGGSSSSTNPSHTYSTPGTYWVCLDAYYWDSLQVNCADSVCYQITIQDTTGGSSCNADFTWTVSGNTVQFTNTSTGTNTNNWSFGDGGSSSSTNPSHTYSTPGTYWVCLDAYYWDSLQVNCADSVCYQITIQDTTGGSSCNADFTWVVSGSTVFLTNTSTGTNANDWTFGDGGSSFVTNPTYTYSNPGTYTICLYSYYIDSMGGFCDDSVCYQVTVFQDSTGGTGCSVGASIYANGPQIVGTNTSTGASIYTWTVSDYNTNASLTNVNTTDLLYTPGYNGDFWVCLTAYDSMGLVCDTLCDVITISDSLDSTANVYGASLNEFRLYPNPSSSVLNIQFDQLPSNSHALIVDMLGREMVEVDLTSQITEIQVAEFPRGIYLVQLFDSNNRIIGMSKFVRE